MIDFTELNARIKPPDEAVMRASRARWDSLAKPLRSLGALEDDVVRIAGVQGALMPDVSRRAVAVMCADNGVVARGVTQTGQEVTAVVAESIARGASSVCRMARVAGAEVYPVDVGVARPVDIPALWQRNVRRGTADMTKGPAMERGEASAAVEAGMEVVLHFEAHVALRNQVTAGLVVDHIVREYGLSPLAQLDLSAGNDLAPGLAFHLLCRDVGRGVLTAFG